MMDRQVFRELRSKINDETDRILDYMAMNDPNLPRVISHHTNLICQKYGVTYEEFMAEINEGAAAVS